MYPLLTNINSQFIDSCGKPLAGGKVYTYEANTTTPKPTYADTNGQSPNTNPIILDESGRANIYMADGAYRIRVLDKKDALVADTPKISRYVTNTELETFIQNIEAGLSELEQVKESLDIFVNAAIAEQKGTPNGLAPLNTDGKVDIDYLPIWIKVAMYTPIPYSKEIPPEGFLMMMGQSIDQPTYPNLYALYGDKLPDMRGYFIRGWDNGRGVDAGRQILADQEDTFKSHTHNVARAQNNGVGDATNRVATANGDSGAASGAAQATGGVETRPKNIAFNYIVLAG